MGVRPGEGGGGSQQNRDNVLVRKSFEVWKDQRGTLTISSGFVTGVSRRMAAGVSGPGKERQGEVGRKVSETNGLQAERIRERGRRCMQLFLSTRGALERK